MSTPEPDMSVGWRTFDTLAFIVLLIGAEQLVGSWLKVEHSSWALGLVLTCLGPVLYSLTGGWDRLLRYMRRKTPRASDPLKEAPIRGGGFVNIGSGRMVVKNSIATGHELGFVNVGSGEFDSQGNLSEGPGARTLYYRTPRLSETEFRGLLTETLSRLDVFHRRYEALPMPPEAAYLAKSDALADEFLRTLHQQAALAETELVARLSGTVISFAPDLTPAAVAAQTILRTGRVAGASPYRSIAYYLRALEEQLPH